MAANDRLSFLADAAYAAHFHTVAPSCVMPLNSIGISPIRVVAVNRLHINYINVKRDPTVAENVFVGLVKINRTREQFSIIIRRADASYQLIGIKQSLIRAKSAEREDGVPSTVAVMMRISRRDQRKRAGGNILQALVKKLLVIAENIDQSALAVQIKQKIHSLPNLLASVERITDQNELVLR